MTSQKAGKSTGKKVEEVVEEIVEVIQEVETPVVETYGYVVPIFFEREPVEKNIPVGDLFYHKVSNSFSLQCHRPNVEAQLEMVVEGDIGITEGGNTIMISKSESPVKWITSLHKSNEFSGNPFIAYEAQELYEA